ncbi:MAG: hypothetical protein J4F43_06750 [Dehalococcoidia bacterium]|nr:hypothetical protein [Dehalococcoidia bacterium]
MRSLKLLLPLAAAGAALAAVPAHAHGFGERYDLPVPLGYFMVGAGAAVALSFVVIGWFGRVGAGGGGYWRYNLLALPLAGPLLTNPLVLLPVKLLSVFLLGLVIAAGLFGSQVPSLNFSPTFVWVVWWVGLGFFVALVGNAWALINPWRAVFEAAEAVCRMIKPGLRLSLGERYPPSWGLWPALVLFLLFAWLENAYPESSVPVRVGAMAITYTVITLGGMAVFGKHQWLRHGEAFSVVFEFLSRFAPTEVRVSGSAVCGECSEECRDEDGECVNCYECFQRSGEGGSDVRRKVNLRPFAIGLARRQSIGPDVVALVVLMLATVTFDGFGATSAWVDVQSESLDAFVGVVNTAVVNGITIADTLGLLLFPAAFLLVYLAFCGLMARAVGNLRTAGELARAFVFSLVPIALAYNIAHFFTLLVVQGQLLIPLSSDPLGRGWDLFGTADYVTDIGVVSARAVWFLSIGAIVAGHITAVYLAHHTATRLFGNRALAMRSQYPMLALMVMYTVVSLWIVAQPIVE